MGQQLPELIRIQGVEDQETLNLSAVDFTQQIKFLPGLQASLHHRQTQRVTEPGNAGRRLRQFLVALQSSTCMRFIFNSLTGGIPGAGASRSPGPRHREIGQLR